VPHSSALMGIAWPIPAIGWASLGIRNRYRYQAQQRAVACVCAGGSLHHGRLRDQVLFTGCRRKVSS
jgi:hypothetical protein